MMRLFEIIIDGFATSVALSAVIFMEFVFLAETFGGSMRYLEPNRPLAAFELFTVAISFPLLVAAFVKRAQRA